jgi:hypothetical protein
MFISFISLGPLDGCTLRPGEGPNIVGYDRISETVIVGLEREGGDSRLVNGDWLDVRSDC